MRQLDNLFGPHIKKFKNKFNDTPSIDISFHSVGDGENGESLYRVSISYLDNYVSDIMSSEDEWDIVGKMFDKLIEDTTTSLRRLAERQERTRDMTMEIPSWTRHRTTNYFRVGSVDVRNSTPVIADEPVEVRQRPISFEDFCDELEEV